MQDELTWKLLPFFKIYWQSLAQPDDSHTMTSSNGNISALLVLCEGNSPVTGEFPSERPVTRSFDVFFELRLNKRLSKQSRRRWFETPSLSPTHQSMLDEIYVCFWWQKSGHTLDRQWKQVTGYRYWLTKWPQELSCRCDAVYNFVILRTVLYWELSAWVLLHDVAEDFGTGNI